MMDHVRLGTTSKRWIKPPKLDLEAVEIFGDCLISTAKKKLAQLEDRYHQIEKNKASNKQIVDDLVEGKKINPGGEYFFRLLYASEYDEIFYCQQWMKYWLKILHVASGGSLSMVEVSLDQAKAYPIDLLYQGELRDSYNRKVGLCPFHEEKTPSFVIYLEENTYHCFGCQAHGDAIDFVMKSENLSFQDAVGRLR